MSPSYPELATDFERISAVVRAEEEAFLRHAHRRLADLRHGGRPTRSRPGGTLLAGDKAFQLHDTYGFPIDLTLEMAAEAGLTVDEEGFRRLMDEQRARAKADAEARKTGHGDLGAYRARARTPRATPSSSATPTWPARRGSSGWSSTGPGCRPPGAGTAVEVVLDRTPFYAEGGGQQADTGVIRGDGFAVAVRRRADRR